MITLTHKESAMQTIVTSIAQEISNSTSTCQFENGTCDKHAQETIWLRGIGSEGAWPVDLCSDHFRRVRRILGGVGMQPSDLGLSPLA